MTTEFSQLAQSVGQSLTMAQKDNDFPDHKKDLYSIEHYRISKSREPDTNRVISNSSRRTKTEHRKSRKRNDEAEILYSIDNLDLTDYKSTMSSNSLGHFSRYTKPSLPTDQEIDTDDLLNNFFVSKINKVRRNRVLSSMEIFEKDLERKRLLNQYLSQKTRSRFGRFPSTPKEVMPMEPKHPRTPKTSRALDDTDSLVTSMSTQTDDPDVTLQHFVIPRATHGITVISNKDGHLSWDCNTVVRNYLINCPDFLSEASDLAPARPSTMVCTILPCSQSFREMS